MARKLRAISNSGCYHVRDIGLDHYAIFGAGTDKEKFREILQRFLEDSGVEIGAYCIMDNHFHLLVSAEKEDLSAYMKKVKGRYTQWFNYKYQRSGTVFDGRFRAEVIKDEEHFREVLRYIHLNPLRAGMTKTVDDYAFSSYNYYMGAKDFLINSDIVFQRVDPREFVALHCKITNSLEWEMFPRRFYMTDEQAMDVITEVVGAGKEKTFGKMERPMLCLVLAELKRCGLSMRQISRLTGISKGIVEKA